MSYELWMEGIDRKALHIIFMPLISIVHAWALPESSSHTRLNQKKFNAFTNDVDSF